MKSLSKVEMVEKFLKSMVKDFEIGPDDLLIGVHNACTHGETWEGANFGKDDKYLQEMFRGFDISIAAAKQVDY